MNTKQKIAIMQAFADGKEIEYRPNKKEWFDLSATKEPLWNFTISNYRIKPKASETDWSKVAVNTPVICASSGKKVNRYFSHYDEHYIYCFTSGGNSHNNEAVVFWLKNEVKLDLNAPSLLNWIKNTGVAPDCKYVIARTHRGTYCCHNAVECLDFSLDCEALIAYYAIIE